MHIPYLGQFPLVLNLTVAGVVLTKILVDGGAGLNILFAWTIDAMRLSRHKLTPFDTPFHRIIPEKSVMPLETEILLQDNVQGILLDQLEPHHIHHRREPISELQALPTWCSAPCPS